MTLYLDQSLYPDNESLFSNGTMTPLAPLWTPAELTTNPLWLDASDDSTVTQSLGKVSQWDDKSGNDNHATQASGSQQPTYSDANDAITGDNSLHMDLPVDMFSGESTAYVVFAGQQVADGSDGGWGMYADTSISGNKTRFPNGTNSEIRGSFSTTTRIVGDANTVYAEGNNLLGAEVHDGTDLEFRLNGLQIGTKQTTAFSTTTSTERLWGMGGGYVLNELIFAVDLSEVETIEGYLAWRWDEIHGNTDLVDALPAGHTYKAAAPRV